MSEEALESSQSAIDEAKKAAEKAPVMPFDDAASPGGETPSTPDESGGAVAEHGNDDATPPEPAESGSGSSDEDDDATPLAETDGAAEGADTGGADGDQDADPAGDSAL